MADLYGTVPSPASEPEEISNFLHQLLNNNSSSSSTTSSSSKFMHLVLSPPPEPHSTAGFTDRQRFSRFDSGCQAAGGSSGGKFSDPGGIFEQSVENAASFSVSKVRLASVESDLGEFGRDSQKGAKESEMPPESVRPRSSSKRSRAAEFHNLSEKRRRSRINEKMKALQTLIPNSNKTDKASMLDEAIEYLKQLQLQVQMLTMRNGLSLHPMCLPGVLHPMPRPLTGMNFDEGNGLLNTNVPTGAFSANEESSVQSGINLTDQRSISNQPIALPSGTNVPSSESTFGFEPLTQVHYGPFILPHSSKEICREETPQAQMDTNQTMKSSSSGVS